MFRVLPDGSIECETEAIALAVQMRTTPAPSCGTAVRVRQVCLTHAGTKDGTERMDKLAAEIILVMREIPLPVHARTVRKELEKRGVPIYGQDPGSTIRNILRTRPVFEQVGKAVYQLAKGQP
jgi:hypothetical protein